MPRKKTSLIYISDKNNRIATLKKRRHGLFKKVQELSVLCAVPACAVVYAEHETQPEVWPSLEEAKACFTKVKSVDGKMMNQEKFLTKQLKDLCAQLDRVMDKNSDLASKVLYLECLDGRQITEMDSYEIGLVCGMLSRQTVAVQDRLLQLSETAGDGGLTPPLIPQRLENSDPSTETVLNEYVSMDFGGVDGKQEMFPEGLLL